MSIIVTLLLVAGLVGIDQVIKVLVSNNIALYDSVPVIPGVVELHHVQNTGAAFSFLEGQQVLLIVLTSIVLVVVAALLIFRQPKDKLEQIAFIMILAGGLGNLINRIAYGYVVDYINLLFMRFAVFNFADCLVCVGFVVLIIAVFRSEHKRKKLEKQQASATDAVDGIKTDNEQETHIKYNNKLYNELESDKFENGKSVGKPLQKDGEA
ncbi:MAG: signal peptidase II [Ruminococcaceae bacterium]|nr:signal peptidase II [Oscillospiraceae bacterium]